MLYYKNNVNIIFPSQCYLLLQICIHVHDLTNIAGSLQLLRHLL